MAVPRFQTRPLEEYFGDLGVSSQWSLVPWSSTHLGDAIPMFFPGNSQCCDGDGGCIICGWTTQELSLCRCLGQVNSIMWQHFRHYSNYNPHKFKTSETLNIFSQHDNRVYQLSQVALRGCLWIALLRCRICLVSVAQGFSLTAPDVHAILTACHPTTSTTRVLRCNAFDNFLYCIRQNFKPGWRQRGRLNEQNLQRQVATQPF